MILARSDVKVTLFKFIASHSARDADICEMRTESILEELDRSFPKLLLLFLSFVFLFSSGKHALHGTLIDIRLRALTT